MQTTAPEDQAAAESGEIVAAAAGDIRPIPRIAIQAFCVSPDIAAIIESAAADRRMSRAHVKVLMGGIAAAIDFYQSAPTPNLILLESQERGDQLLSQLDQLAAVCDAGTKVIVIGHVNDVLLYRDLIRRGISEYMVAPIDIFDIMRTVADIYDDPDAEPLGRTMAFIGAKGGSGASTVAHNVAWSISNVFRSNVVVADMDLAFGTAGLDFNQDPPQGIAEAVNSPDRLDDVFLDRLLAKCTDQLSLLAAPSTLDRSYDFAEEAFDGVIEVVRQGVPCVILDMPHVWSSWVRHVLLSVDDVVVVAEPDLANLRNAKNLIDILAHSRPNDAPAKLVINKVGMPKRPEIKPEEIASSLDVAPLAVLPFEPGLFGTAANNGQMIAEIDQKHHVVSQFDFIAQIMTGRGEVQRPTSRPLLPLLSKLKRRNKG